jgi:hypothetical protein
MIISSCPSHASKSSLQRCAFNFDVRDFDGDAARGKLCAGIIPPMRSARGRRLLRWHPAICRYFAWGSVLTMAPLTAVPPAEQSTADRARTTTREDEPPLW